MLFNSIQFLVFLPTVFALYWFAFRSPLRLQNPFVLVASYVFYGWWDWRFLGLIIISTVVDYLVGLRLQQATRSISRRALLITSLGVNLGLLGFFKYWNFFIDSWISAWASAGVTIHPATIEIILPVGISFYTFQTLSYTIDIYRRKIEPTRDFVAFAAFVAFFPQLVAGPIERASTLLPQFLKPRQFSYSNAAEGVRQILWGLFKKIVIADQLAIHVDDIFANYESLPSSVLILGMIFFAFQIYCDFSGYSDIAIGTARLFGFRLMVNFYYPYFSRNIAEFWRRWHISLSTWFRDYVYIPLGGSRVSTARALRNVIIVFTVSGLWHGANWTFIAWGMLHALYFVPLFLLGTNRRYLDDAAAGKLLPSIREFAGIVLTFTVTCLAWVFFRAPSLDQAFEYIQRIFTGWSAGLTGTTEHLPVLLLVVAFTALEWVYRHKEFPLSRPSYPRWVRYTVYFLLTYFTIIGSKRAAEFIYFQF
ncbi:MAG: membrane-bound O-acyltransferase family protein [Chromatiales bacterium]|nr:membrane-bound O-acyltransferase family protein [Chromatiales bacterium]